MSVHRALCVCQQCHCHCQSVTLKCHLHMNGHQSDSNVSSIMSHSVSFRSVAILHQSEVAQLITQHNQTLCTARPYMFYRSELSCVKQKNMKLQNTKTTYKTAQKNEGNLPLVPYCTSQHPKVYFGMHHPPQHCTKEYKLIHLTTHICQQWKEHEQLGGIKGWHMSSRLQI